MCEELLKNAVEKNAGKYREIAGRFPALVSDEVMEYLRGADYFTAPSSFKHHGNWIGGNFDHSMNR